MYWAYFAALLDLHASTSFNLDSTLTFLLKTWLESYKSAINTQQARTKRNWRNKGRKSQNKAYLSLRMNPKYLLNPMQK